MSAAPATAQGPHAPVRRDPVWGRWDGTCNLGAWTGHATAGVATPVTAPSGRFRYPTRDAPSAGGAAARQVRVCGRLPFLDLPRARACLRRRLVPGARVRRGADPHLRT